MKRFIAAALFCLAVTPSTESAIRNPCPLRTDGVKQNGLAVLVTVTNPSQDATRLRAVVITYSDYLNKYYERSFRFDVLVQPRQTVRLSTPVLDGVVDFSTVAASVKCAKDSEEDE